MGTSATLGQGVAHYAGHVQVKVDAHRTHLRSVPGIDLPIDKAHAALKASMPGIARVAFRRDNATIHAQIHCHGDFSAIVRGDSASAWLESARQRRISAQEFAWLLGIHEHGLEPAQMKRELHDALGQIYDLIKRLEHDSGVVSFWD